MTSTPPLAEPERVPMDKKITWGVIREYMDRAKCHIAFPILVSLAQQGDPEAHYMACQIKGIHAEIGQTPIAKTLDNIPVQKNPFQNVSPDHPAYQIAIQNPLNMIARAREGRGRAAMLAGLYYMTGNETTKQPDGGAPKNRPRYGRALRFFATSLRDPDHHATKYNIELIRRNVCHAVDKISSVHCDTRNRRTYAVFVDGSKVNIDVIDEAYRIINCLNPYQPRPS